MVKKVLSMFILVLPITFTLQVVDESKVEAGAVQIYDGGVGHIIDFIRKGANVKNISLREPYYTTIQGIKYCMIDYGSYDDNQVVLRLNDNGAVSRAIITFYTDDIGLYQAVAMLTAVVMAVGLDLSEIQNLSNLNNNYGSTWCFASNRYITYKYTYGALFVDAYI